MDLTHITLGALLSHANETIRRNAMGILKQLRIIDTKKLIQEYTTFVDFIEMKSINPKKGDSITFERDGLTWRGEVLRVYKDGCDIYTY